MATATKGRREEVKSQLKDEEKTLTKAIAASEKELAAIPEQTADEDREVTLRRRSVDALLGAQKSALEANQYAQRSIYADD